MTDSGESTRSATSRMAVYALSGRDGVVDDHVYRALGALRLVAAPLVVVAPGRVDRESIHRLERVADRVLEYPDRRFTPQMYAEALADGVPDDVGEVILTGDRWFGPVADLEPVLSRAASMGSDYWVMVGNDHGLPEEFPEQGFVNETLPWLWTAVGRRLFSSPAWREYWAGMRARAEDAGQEYAFGPHMAAVGFTGSAVFSAADYPGPHAHPAQFNPMGLLADGCPIVSRDAFVRYPPFLDRHAVIGRELLRQIEATGYPAGLILQNLARTVAPKALYANLGLLEVLPEKPRGFDANRPPRVLVIAHVTDLSAFPQLLDGVANIPVPFDLVVTTTDGALAAKVQRIVESRPDVGEGLFEVRVTPAGRGRDMSAFLVGCRDLLLDDSYDLVMKLHARRADRKTANVRRYFLRYQYENLLSSSGYITNLLALFQREPGLGVVFPPMMHIGHATMGRGWAHHRDTAERLLDDVGVHVPVDRVSPLAPFGGMFIARPRALRLLTSRRWRYTDYARSMRVRYPELARVQERVISYVSAEAGYHTRTVMNREHASISHSALDFKVDQLFSTTRGYPVEQINLLQRAGNTGYGGIVAITRMYLRVNHPRVARRLVPVYRLAARGYGVLAAGRRLVGRVRGADEGVTDEDR